MSATATRAPRADRPSLGARAFTVLDLSATSVRGIAGAAVAAHAGFDLLGIVVVGFIVAVAGGMLRDLLLGEVPPAALRSPSRIVTALLSALAAFVLIGVVDAVPAPVLLTLDGVGLALFAAIGAQKAYAHGANPWVVVIVGIVSAAGGGVIRDVLVGRPPVLLTQGVYGTAAAAGALVTGVLLTTTRRPRLSIALGFAVAFGVRITALLWGWSLPRIG